MKHSLVAATCLFAMEAAFAQATATGRIKCMENGQWPSFEITAQTTQPGADCASARAAVQQYFQSADRCRSNAGATYPNRSWPGGEITYLQTNTCR